MKWFILPLFIIFYSLQTYAQWTNEASPVPDFIHGICYPSDQVGYINDIAGNVSKTINGGMTWSNFIHITSGRTHYPYFLNSEKGFISSIGGKILRTENGGDSWQTIQLNTNVWLFKFSFPTTSRGYIIGNSGYIAKTNDGGLSWSNIISPTSEDLRAVTFLDTSLGWIGGTGCLYKTTNGGNTWVRYNGISNYATVREISFPSQTIGYIVGDNGIIYKTTNQGIDWFVQSSPTSSSLNCATFLNDERGYAVGNYGSLIVTTNGGQNWMAQNSGVSHHLVAAYFKNSSIGYVGGGIEGSYNPSVLLKTNNGGFPAPFLNLTSPNGSETWLVGSSHQIKWTNQMATYLNLDYTTNNGITWLSIATNYPAALNSYSWIVPNTPSGNCKVRITDAAASLTDVSDNVFTINSITVTTPNGGECWQVLTNHNIKWTSTNVTSVNLDYSTNNGTTWISIAQEYNNSGTYNWTVPNVTSNNCKVKISDASMNGNYDISNATFSITPEVVLAKITADTLYYDSNFLGTVDKQVSGSTSIGNNLTYNWIINDVDVYNNVAPTITLHSGLNKIKLQVTGASGANSSDSMFTNIIASRNITGGKIYSGISEYNNRFYLTSADKAVYEIDSLGNKLKSFLTGGSLQSVLTISQSGKLFTGSTDTRMYSFDPNLIPIWDKATGGVIKYAPAISGDGATVYCATNTGNLIAYDVATGNLKWGFQTEGVVTSSPVVMLDDNNKDVIYAGTSSGYLYAVRDNGATGDLFWRKELSDTIFSSVAVFPNGLNSMLFTGTKGGYLYRIKWDGTFEENWKVNINSPIYSSPVIDGDNVIYIGAKNGGLYAYSIDFSSTSSPLFSYPLESGIIGTPAISNNGNLYVGTEKGYLYTFSKDSTLTLLWKSNLYSSIVSSALVTESGLIYTGTVKGDVFVIKEPSFTRSLNKPIWPTYMGNNQRSKVTSINVTGLVNDEVKITDYKLMQNYPNPFNPTTKIDYQVPYSSNVIIDIYSVTGEKVVNLINKNQTAGYYSVELGTSHNLASGIYFYRMSATSIEGNHNFTSIRKMILLK